MSLLKKFDMHGKTAVVTGGAQGLGKAMALGLAEAGCNIVIADINPETMDQAVNEIKMLGVKSKGIVCDISNPEDCASTLAETVMEFGKLDVVINNAGIARHNAALGMSVEEWNKVFDINVNGTFYMAQAAGRIMAKSGGGSIINISSISGIISNMPQGQSNYNSSKAAVIHMTRSLAGEWAKLGIRVNTIAPGYMRTEMTREMFEKGGETVEMWMKLTPMGRPGEPEELAGIALYLASDASTFTTGGVFTIDGGYTCW